MIFNNFERFSIIRNYFECEELQKASKELGEDLQIRTFMFDGMICNEIQNFDINLFNKKINDNSGYDKIKINWDIKPIESDKTIPKCPKNFQPDWELTQDMEKKWLLKATMPKFIAEKNENLLKRFPIQFDSEGFYFHVCKTSSISV